MSQHEWKFGDRAMVEIAHSETHCSDGTVAIKGRGSWHTIFVPHESLHPLPTPDPITELERAVIEEAVRWERVTTEMAVRYLEDENAPFIDDKVHIPLHVAIGKLRAARTPPAPVDPMTALRNAWEASRGLLWAEGVHAALVAAEAAWKEIKK